jgi:ParB family chromosome partitioning protein
MTEAEIRRVELIPIERLTVLNPRVRSRRNFEEIIDNIARVGLKRPITVSRRIGPDGEVRFNLVCGQGRLEAFAELNVSQIPALVIDAADPDCMVMSLVENFARRRHRAIELMQAVETLRKRSYDDAAIATKIGVTTEWVRLLGELFDKGEQRLIAAVEMGLMPIKLAIEISRTSDSEIQSVLTRVYDEKKLRGRKLVKVRRILEQRSRTGGLMREHALARRHGARRPLSTVAVMRIYRQEADRQKVLIKKAELTQSRLLFVVEALRTLRRDDNFVTLLRAEGLNDIPRDLYERLAA